jgi:hypothetical protein
MVRNCRKNLCVLNLKARVRPDGALWMGQQKLRDASGPFQTLSATKNLTDIIINNNSYLKFIDFFILV